MDVKRARELFAEFFSQGKREVYSRRSSIIPYNHDITRGYIIIEGCVKVSSHNKNGNERIHYLYGPGEFFPVTWMFMHTTYNIEFSAFTDVTVQSLSLDKIKLFFETCPLALLVIIEQQSAAYDRIINLNLGSAEQRIAHRMVTLAKRFGKKVDDHYMIDMLITVQELADMVRLTRESAGRVVADFERKGYILMGRRATAVYTEPLKKIADA